MSSPRNDLVKNYRVHPTHWLISTQVTGTKFEEPDEKKNPQRRGGHQVKGMKEVDPETAKRMEAVRAAQKPAERVKGGVNLCGNQPVCRVHISRR